ncbi:MAG TPA: response regulator [Oligoflexia bacterium]|nr:response regulator [Oligoflexia bacterium]HMP49634.1 response regulator [Oligoflexia bacterium]
MNSKILIIEDSPLQRAVIANVVKELGFTPVLAENFDSSLINIIEQEDIFIVLLDLMLQNEDGEVLMDGFQLCAEMKQQRNGLKVVVVSAEDDEAAREFAMLQGADGFISKPFRVQDLRDCIQSIE